MDVLLYETQQKGNNSNNNKGRNISLKSNKKKPPNSRNNINPTDIKIPKTNTMGLNTSTKTQNSILKTTKSINMPIKASITVKIQKDINN